VPPENAAALAAARATGETVALGRDGLVSYIHTYVLVMLLYMAVALYGQFVAGSVAAEKSNRAMELLITNARPTQLMFGKVLGAGTAGLLQMSLFLAAAFAGYHINYELWQGDALMRAVFAMPASLACYAALFFVLGFFLYASLYAALGSLVSRSEEVSTTTMPVTLVFIVSFMVVMVSAGTGNVENAAMYAASFIPFTSPMAMFVRIAMGAPTAVEIALSVGILAISAMLVALTAAGIYRVGVLLYGKPPKIKELYRTLRAAGSR
jgi:ABC-2 type transport system permease protein